MCVCVHACVCVCACIHISLHFAIKDNNLLRISPDDLASYWERQEAGLGYKPPGFGKVPLGIYGDDARFTKSGDKIIMVSVNAVLHEPRVGEIKRYPVFTLREFLCLGNRSLFPVCRILAWSFNAARRRMQHSLYHVSLVLLLVVQVHARSIRTLAFARFCTMESTRCMTWTETNSHAKRLSWLDVPLQDRSRNPRYRCSTCSPAAPDSALYGIEHGFNH